MELRLSALRKLISRYSQREEALQAVVACLREAAAHYDWVGIYLLEGERLRLAAWDGPEATEHTDIEIGSGICGLAARTKQTVIVDDVHAREEYLACFPGTKSEIVVPLMRGDECVGDIDIDSDALAAFGEDDRSFLEKVASVVVAAYLSR